MDQRVRELFGAEILAECAGRFGVEPGDLRELGGFESYVYEFAREGRPYILRVSHSMRYSAERIRGEVDWINYLADRGIPACRAVPSLRGALAEVVEVAEGHFTAVAFTKAPGDPPWGERWTPQVFTRLGQVMARMHVLSRGYRPGPGVPRRPHWYDEVEEYDWTQGLAAGDEKVATKFNELMDRQRGLAADADNYGLIHIDLHGGNYFVHEGEVHIFDFADCLHSWYVDDIAVALFYAVPLQVSEQEKIRQSLRYIEPLLAGYRQQRPIGADALAHIPHFMKVREVFLYLLLRRFFGERELDDGWGKIFMEGRRELIEQDAPYLDFDFTAL